uniref:Uncharacterized protein n=1 Tax=Anguilla anguilla TaxID=7936 RepID=A0A0E9UQZ1_ANGAN
MHYIRFSGFCRTQLSSHTKPSVFLSD